MGIKLTARARKVAIEHIKDVLGFDEAVKLGGEHITSCRNGLHVIVNKERGCVGRTCITDNKVCMRVIDSDTYELTYREEFVNDKTMPPRNIKTRVYTPYSPYLDNKASQNTLNGAKTRKATPSKRVMASQNTVNDTNEHKATPSIHNKASQKTVTSCNEHKATPSKRASREMRFNKIVAGWNKPTPRHTVNEKSDTVSS